MTPPFELRDVLAFLVEATRALTHAGGVAIAVGQGGEIRCVARAGALAPPLGARVRPDGMSGECIRDACFVHCRDTEVDPRVDRAVCRALGIRSAMAVPLGTRQKFLGLIEVFSIHPGAFGQRERDVLESVARVLLQAFRSLRVLEGQVPETMVPNPEPPEPVESVASVAPETAPEPAAEELDGPKSVPDFLIYPPTPETSSALPYFFSTVAAMVLFMALLWGAAPWRKAFHFWPSVKPQAPISRAQTLPSLPETVSLDMPYRPVIAAQAVATTTPPLRVAEALKSARQFITRAPDLAPQDRSGHKIRIVIDPGHGGQEFGAIGCAGLPEKNLVLDVAQRLGALLVARLGAEVIFTRTDDSSVPLEARSLIANQADADLVISIHGNSSPSRLSRGVETYYFDSGSTGSPQDRLDEERATASRKLALAVQHAQTADAQQPDRGVKIASFTLLTHVTMPAVLTEIGFLTNPTDEHDLQSEAARERVAEELCRGIASYLHVPAKRSTDFAANDAGKAIALHVDKVSLDRSNVR